jgi:hypothetical protein
VIVVRNQVSQFIHNFSGTGILFFFGLIVFILSGCMIPAYQNPSGFSETYKRNMDALPLPEPSDRLTQKVLYDLVQFEQVQAYEEQLANAKNGNQDYKTASNKGLEPIRSPGNQDVPNLDSQEDEPDETDLESESDLENINYQRVNNRDEEDEIDPDSGEEFEEEAELTRWQKLTRFFAR